MKTSADGALRIQQAVTRVVRRITPFWVAFVILGSFLPTGQKQKLGIQPFVLHQPVPVQHRLVHVATFSVTAMLFLLPADRLKGQVRAVAAASLLGCGIEVAQFAFQFAFQFAGALEWWDVRDDVAGAFGALVIMRTLRWALVVNRH
jgi:hypothetical protein